MKVYHGTAARFPMKELQAGPDTAAILGKPMPGLWLTTQPRMAALYASWSADCTRDRHLRVIALEMRDECTRWHNPQKPEDLVVREPRREFENGNLRVLRGYRIKRYPVQDSPAMWELRVAWDLDEARIIVPHAKMMSNLPPGTEVWR